MNLYEAIEERHSVRQYQDKKIDLLIVNELEEFIKECNKEGNLNIQLVTDEPAAFSGIMAKYGKFDGVTNYIALVGKRSSTLDERLGYYGEKIAIRAGQLGLNTCWVAMTYSKGKSQVQVKNDEKLICVLSLGYGKNKGVPHNSKPDRKSVV